MFLPKKGLGKKPAKGGKPPVSGPPKKKSVNNTKFEFGNIIVDNNFGFIKEFKIQIKPGDNTFAVEFKIASDGDPISAENWIGDSFPIDTMSIEIDEIITKEEVKSINHYFAFNDSFSNIKFEWLSLKNRYNYGFKLSLKREDIVEVTGKIHYLVVDPSISLIISKRSGVE
jgi:hypothetical protein